MAERGVNLKFYGPWQRAAGIGEFFLPLMNDGITVSCLLEKLDSVFGDNFSSHGEGLICLFDEKEGPRALKMGEKVFHGSTVLFLDIVESG